MIKYSIQPRSPEAHIYEIRLTVSNPDPRGQKLTLPAWIPGSYMIRDFAKNIVKLEVLSGDENLKAIKTDKQTWQCSPCNGELSVCYQVYAWDLSVRSAHLDTTHGYFNGTSVFLKVVGQEEEPSEVEILAPEGNGYSEWRVATTLPSAGAEHLGFGLYSASSYDELIDHPVEMGTFSHATFDVNGTPHEIAITGRHDGDMERLCADLKQICQTHVDMFGELPEMERYLFQVMVVGDGYGGLEHRSSTSLICNRTDLPYSGQEKVSEDYRRFLGLCSHEYFHLWNVKRIRPQVFKQSDLSEEVYSGLLWAFEGITSYYDDLALVRSGLIDPDSYLELLAQTITRVTRGSGRLKQTVQESSFDAWTKFYKQDENAPNAIVSYYTKGSLIALALDLKIRNETGGDKSLDDVMRALWIDHGKPDVGLSENALEPLISEVTGIDLSGYFDQALRSTDELPLKELFETVAVGYELRSAAGSKDKGGIRKESEDDSCSPDLGMTWKKDPSGARLVTVSDMGPACGAGLSAGDNIIAINGLKVSADNIDSTLKRLGSNRTIEVHAFRRDELMSFQVEIRASEPNTCILWRHGEMPDSVIKKQEKWLFLG